MKFRQFFNQQGMTLVELLAALGLFAVVIALSSTVIVQMIGSENKVSDNITLKQETNVIINELKSDYHKKSDYVELGDSFSICYNEDNEVNITDLRINNERVNIENGCTEEISKQKSVNVELTTKNNSNEEFLVKTSWNSKNDQIVSINVNNDQNEEEQNIACELEGSIVLDNVTFKKGDCNNRYTIRGSVVFSNQTFIEEDVTLHIHGSAQFLGNIILDTDSKIITSGSAAYVKKVFCKDIEVPAVNNKSTIHCKPE